MDSEPLHKKKCIPCEGDVPPLTGDQAESYLAKVSGWELQEGGKKIQKTFSFDDFVAAMEFMNAVADVAEGEGHHPDMHVSYDTVVIDLSTHSIGGLSENDFIVAAKIDRLRE